MNETTPIHPGPADHSAGQHDRHASGGHSCCSSLQATAGADEAAQPLKDPVCGMTVTAQSRHVFEHEDRPVYFCSAGCKAKFAADPGKYRVAASGAEPPAPTAAPALDAPAVAGAIYTCPMHPEVRQDHTGACPQCGMALEPEMPTLDDAESP